MSPTPPTPRPPYPKPWLSTADQVKQLVSRGLTVVDAAAAEAFLSHINYYRFSGYCVAFEQQRDLFCVGVTFEQVRAAYDFDFGLRDLVTEALEVVEVDFRAAIAYHFGQQHGPFGHVQPTTFYSAFDHGDWLTRVREESERSNEPFIEHFRTSYAEFPDLPIWMVMEVMSFGALSKMYKGMYRADQKIVAQRYGVQPTDLVTIFHHLVYVRNLCAHHSRLWDRVWAIKPSLPHGKAWKPPLLPANDRLFATLLLLYHLMKQCPALAQFCPDWRDRVNAHMANLPPVLYPLSHMGMPDKWEQNSAWQ